MLTKKALAAALGAVMSVALLTAGTAAPAGAQTKATTSLPGAGTLPFTVCKLQYLVYYTLRDVLNICCWRVADAPLADCGDVWYPYYSGAARSAPASPGRTS
ncbi:hypothetical protein WBK31_12160 [Nonomuraea sp. N2-4H]|jgi:hypothetical protein|uniref:hypothetical protein n=1 Tax=unclassified Nonomuraea TaxID=2593643 RepID=UPI003248D8C4